MRKPKLLYGPYLAPRIKPGDTLFDERFGLVITRGYSGARIPWPERAKTGRTSLILCGDLVEAVKRESAEAIRYFFGVGAGTVWAWRKALGVDRMTEGTTAVYRDIMPDKLPPDVTARARREAATPESIEKIRKSKLGKPMHPNTKKALLEAVKRPKSVEWKRAMAENMREQWRSGKRTKKVNKRS